MRTKLYTVQTTKYTVCVQPIVNIEDAGDDFVTEDELSEMLGGEPFYGTGTTYRKQLIVDELEMWKAKIVERNTKTIVITDQELIDCLTGSAHSVSDYVKGLRRVGNRLFLHAGPAEKTEATKRDGDRLVNAAILAVNRTMECFFDLKYVSNDREKAVLLIKKLVKWEDLKFSDERQAMLCKQVWDNPALFND